MYKTRVLQDHLKMGNTFYPPFTFDGGESRFTQVDWRADILPELIWIGLLVQAFGFDQAREMACGLAFLADQVHAYGNRPNFGTLSGYDTLSSRWKQALNKKLDAHGLREDLSLSLSPLFRLYPKCPLKFILGGQPPTVKKREAVQVLGPVLDECLFRQEKLPTFVQGIYYDALLASGKLKLCGPVERHDTAVLKDYPDSEEAKKVAGFMRCGATGLPMEKNLPGAKQDPWWPAYFWNRGLKIGPCDPMKSDDLHPGSLSQSFLLFLMDCFGDYSDGCTALWERVHEKYPYDLHWSIRDEVLLGLASRIYRLTVQIVSFPPNWTEDVGQVFLRMVVESYIYYQWLKTKGSREDFDAFYHHGLGQQKLRMEHTRAYLNAQGFSAEDIEEMNDGLRFIKNHKMPEFIPVNIGNPLSKDLRTLAEEADIKEFHALIFGPTSSAVHGMYDTLDQYYLRVCLNPFHCRHRVPYYWYKSPLSGYGLCNTLSIADWVITDLLRTAGLRPPKRMPGEKFLARLFTREEFEKFVGRKDVRRESKRQEDLIRKRWAERSAKGSKGKEDPKK